MKKNSLEVFCGNGRGKTAMAIGEAVKAFSAGESVIVIQFLKGSERGEVDVLERLDQADIKIFRFEKQEIGYDKLTEQEKAEERLNILNGLNFARKVIATRECDFLVLDEILGLIEMGIVSDEAVKELLRLKDDSMRMILTGRELPSWLTQYVDSVTTISTQDYRGQ
ncbi:MAG: cob(I)yrinic acid a,c-diamide adenosyltransferase [Blautia sp.]|nr:cob(I)yrinic acid a,c-diamide adenosyltransferase [Blautia sp.]